MHARDQLVVMEGRHAGDVARSARSRASGPAARAKGSDVLTDIGGVLGAARTQCGMDKAAFHATYGRGVPYVGLLGSGTSPCCPNCRLQPPGSMNVPVDGRQTPTSQVPLPLRLPANGTSPG